MDDLDQRLHSKRALAEIIHERLGISVNPAAMFDVQVKRIHEYKRQLLNLLHTVALYQAIRAEPGTDWVPRVKIFSGKAAASYHQAKRISSAMLSAIGPTTTCKLPPLPGLTTAMAPSAFNSASTALLRSTMSRRRRVVHAPTLSKFSAPPSARM